MHGEQVWLRVGSSAFSSVAEFMVGTAECMVSRSD
jgi:hypothetical protein